LGVLLKWTVNKDNVKVDIILSWRTFRISGDFGESKQCCKFHYT